jgi:hypothetical protein
MVNDEPALCMIAFTSHCGRQVPPQIMFKLSDLDVMSGASPVPNELNLLLSCGPIPSLSRVKLLLDDISRMVEQMGSMRSMGSMRLPGAGYTPLEWAARKGNLEIAELLCKHPVTAATVKTGAPVGWACYTGQVELAKMLVRYGADPALTDVPLWGSRPPVHVAAANGQLLAMKWLVEECKQDIHVESEAGGMGGRGKKRNLIELLQFELGEVDPISMRQAGMAGHAACLEYAILAGVEKRRISAAELEEVRVRLEQHVETKRELMSRVNHD